MSHRQYVNLMSTGSSSGYIAYEAMMWSFPWLSLSLYYYWLIMLGWRTTESDTDSHYVFIHRYIYILFFTIIAFIQWTF